MELITITPDNIDQSGVYCIKDKNAVGYQDKIHWYRSYFKQGLRMIIAKGKDEKQMGFIEYMPAEIAWRPLIAPGFLFIQCMFVYPNKNRSLGLGTTLIKEVEKQALAWGKNGICSFTSKGPWINDQRLLKKNDFLLIDKLERFELLAKKFDHSFADPHFINWTDNRKGLNGWHLFYANQCPWHAKAVEVLVEVADQYNLNLVVHPLKKPEDVWASPSGFGVFSLVRDGRVLADHYISERRFKNILRKEGMD